MEENIFFKADIKRMNKKKKKKKKKRRRTQIHGNPSCRGNHTLPISCSPVSQSQEGATLSLCYYLLSFIEETFCALLFMFFFDTKKNLSTYGEVRHGKQERKEKKPHKKEKKKKKKIAPQGLVFMKCSKSV